MDWLTSEALTNNWFVSEIIKGAKSAPFVVVVLGYVYLAHLLALMIVPFSTMREVAENRNLAVALRHCGLVLGTALGLTAAIEFDPAHYRADLFWALIDGGVLTVLMVIVSIISDKVVIHNASNKRQLQQQNVAVGITEGSMFLATGFIAYGALSIENVGQLTALAFFGLGQVALLATALVYEILTPFRVVDLIKNGNKAAGITLGGLLVSISLILSGSIAGPFQGWIWHPVDFVCYSVVGTIMMFAAGFIADKMFIPTTNIMKAVEEDEYTQTIVIGSVTLVTAFSISVAVVQ